MLTDENGNSVRIDHVGDYGDLMKSVRKTFETFDGERVVGGKRYNLKTAEVVAYRLEIRSAVPTTSGNGYTFVRDTDAVAPAIDALVSGVNREYVGACDSCVPLDVCVHQIVNDPDCLHLCSEDGDSKPTPFYAYDGSTYGEDELVAAVANRFETVVKGGFGDAYDRIVKTGHMSRLRDAVELLAIQEAVSDPMLRVAVDALHGLHVPLAFVRLDIIMRKRGGRYFVYTETTAPYTSPADEHRSDSTFGFYAEGERFGKRFNPFPPYLVENRMLDSAEFAVMDDALPLSGNPSLLALLIPDDDVDDAVSELSGMCTERTFRALPTASSFYPISYDDARILARAWLSEEDFEDAFSGDDERTQSVTVKISSNAKHLLNERANASGESFSEVVEAALRSYLGNAGNEG